MKHSFKYNTKLTSEKSFHSNILAWNASWVSSHEQQTRAPKCHEGNNQGRPLHPEEEGALPLLGSPHLPRTGQGAGRRCPFLRTPCLCPPPVYKVQRWPSSATPALPFLWPTSHRRFRWLGVHVCEFQEVFLAREREEGSSSSPAAPDGSRNHRADSSLSARPCPLRKRSINEQRLQNPGGSCWKAWSESWTWGTWWERARPPHTSQPPYRQPLGMLRSPRRKREGCLGETESVASSQADAGTHHWTSRNKMGQIISFFVFIAFV